MRGEPRRGPAAVGFDLRTDPEEQTPGQPDTDLEAMAASVKAPTPGEAAEVNVEALRALGYVD